MIKRILSIFLALILVFSVAACGNEKTTTGNQSTVSSTVSETNKDDVTSSEEDASEVSSSTEDTSKLESQYVSTEQKISVPATAELSFTSLPAEHSVLLNSNPDRGWRSVASHFVPEESKLISNPEDYTYEAIKNDVSATLAANTFGEKVTVCAVYFVMSNYIEKDGVAGTKNYYDLPQVALDYIDNHCKAYQELGIKMTLGIYYMQENGTSSDKLYYEKVRISNIMHHVEAYWGPLWEKWKDNIYVLNFTLLGRYGEWTSLGDSCLPEGLRYYGKEGTPITKADYDKYTAESQKKLVDLVLDTAPEELYIIMRYPDRKANNVSKDHPRYSRIGFFQAALFGKLYASDSTIGQGTWLPDDTGGWWTMAMKEAPYTVMDSEFFTSRWFNLRGLYIPSDTCITTLSELRMGVMSVNHSYADYNQFQVDLQRTNLQGWKGEEVTAESLKAMGVFVSPTWFTNRSDETIQRNAFEYVRDYLGYRLSAETVSITGGTKAGESINVKMNFKNYGFSAAFNLTSGFAILDENNKVVSTVNAGDPTTWHSSDPENYSDRTLLSHSINADMKLPTEAGTYKIAFFMNNKVGQTARLDNTIEYANGYNILHMFTID